MGVFAYESKESLILNTDAKYYKRNEQKPFNGLGLFENEFSYLNEKWSNRGNIDKIT